jgi:hypothetical protein
MKRRKKGWSVETKTGLVVGGFFLSAVALFGAVVVAGQKGRGTDQPTIPATTTASKPAAQVATVAKPQVEEWVERQETEPVVIVKAQPRQGRPVARQPEFRPPVVGQRPPMQYQPPQINWPVSPLEGRQPPPGMSSREDFGNWLQDAAEWSRQHPTGPAKGAGR